MPTPSEVWSLLGGVGFVAVTTDAMTGGVDAAGYDLTALGWLQFEQLCTELFALHGVSPEAWLGEADSARWVTVPAAAAEALAGRRVAEPAVVCVVWFPRWVATKWDARNRVAEAIAGSEAAAAGSVLVLTNAIANADLGALVGEHASSGVEVVGFGRAELGRLVEVNRLVVAVLGLRAGREDRLGQLLGLAQAGR